MGPKSLKMKMGDRVTCDREKLWVVHRKDMRNIYTLTNMRASPVEGKSTDEPSHDVKPHVTEKLQCLHRFVDKSDSMPDNYGTARRTWKWTNKLFSHLTNMALLNALLIHESCGNKPHKNFRL